MKLLATSLLSLAMLMVACQATEPERSIDYQPFVGEDHYNVAFLIMEGTYNTEFTAPWDIFHHTIFRKGIKPMTVFSVAKTTEPITTFEGVKVLPNFDYLHDSLPRVDILVIPSAAHHLDTDLDDTAMLDFVTKASSKAKFVLSLCDGAFVLAKAGLLDKVVSTTFPADIPDYKTMFPQLRVADSAMVVHDGKYITSAGGARSFDAALYLCEYLYGKQVADELAKGMVIDWQLDQAFVLRK